MILVGACASTGRFKPMVNPKKPGKIPKFSEEQLLLGKMTPYRSCFDVHYYDIHITVDPDQKMLSGDVDIYSTAQSDFDTFQIDLHPNFQITQMIDKMTGDSLPYRRKERAVFIRSSHKKGDQFVIRISYNGKPQVAKKPPWLGGFVWKKDKEGNPWDGVACESEGASIWWPSKDHPGDEADSVRMHYTVPKGLVAVGNGQFEGKSETAVTSTYNWFSSYPINTYNITIYVGKFKLLEDKYNSIIGKELKLHHYVLTPHYNTAKEHFKQVHEILRFYEEKFGEYPWYRDGFGLVEAPFTGMEHQTAIAYGNEYGKYIYDSAYDYIIVHETAHEWWGNSVTAADFSDMWLQEGFATYSEALFMEHVHNNHWYHNYLNAMRYAIQNKYPLITSRGTRWFDYKKNDDVYSKGAWILQTLRYQIDNDSIFFDILKTFAERYKYKLVSSGDFINLVNEKTKDDYSWLFNTYLYRNEVPQLDCYENWDGKFYYRWSNVPPEFNKIKLRFRSINMNTYIQPNNDIQYIQVNEDLYGTFKISIPYDVLVVFHQNRDLKPTP